MAVTLITARISNQLALTINKTANISGAGVLVWPFTLPNTEAVLTDGTGAAQADLFCEIAGSVTSGTPVDYNLSNSSLENAFGEGIAFASIVYLFLRNTSSSGVLTLGAGTNPITSFWAASGDGIKVQPGGEISFRATGTSAYAVTASTADILRVTSSSGTINYHLVMVGRTA